mmetsp:Transcript_25623/g.55386  ORF Transcript_25623/g.55386 Transcript_25623/m.55386 type:complete len:231 (-) Transcript_25623:172-864(-)
MAAHLVLYARDLDIVALADNARIVHVGLWDKEERDALGPFGCTWQPSEHAVHNVLGHVVLTTGDEDLSSCDAVRAIICQLSLRRHLPEIGAALRLCQAHCARELARDHWWQPLVLELIGRVVENGLDSALGEAGEHEPRIIRRGHQVRLHERERGGQVLPAVLLWERETLPSCLAVEIISLLEAGRRFDRVGIDPFTPGTIGPLVQRRELSLAQLCRRLNHHINRLAVAS